MNVMHPILQNFEIQESIMKIFPISLKYKRSEMRTCRHWPKLLSLEAWGSNYLLPFYLVHLNLTNFLKKSVFVLVCMKFYTAGSSRLNSDHVS